LIGRPMVIHDWLQHAWSLTYYPNLLGPNQLNVFGNTWWSWWIICQPKWRVKAPNGKGFVPLSGKGDWSKLWIGGNNGMLLHIMALAWWGNAGLNDPNEMEKWTSGVKDVSWVLEHMHVLHKK
jgi:hypothetical protein